MCRKEESAYPAYLRQGVYIGPATPCRHSAPCMLVRSVRARRATRIRSYYTTHCTLKTQTMAVACPWILGSRLSIILSTQATSLGECEPVRMLSVALGVDPDISHAVFKDCHVRTKSMFNQAGSSSRMRSAFPVSLPCNLFDREAPHSYGQGGHSGEDHMP